MNRTNKNPPRPAPAEAGCRTGFFLVGPTASGKSAVAQLAAEDGGRAILSADSMLVYRGMDIGTAKPGVGDRGRAPHYGIDLVRPDENFSVGRYLRRVARQLQETDAGRGAALIVAGGTGLYVNALLYGLAPLPQGDPERRAYWSLRLREGGAAELREELRRLSPAMLDRLADADNPRRLMRALELAEAGIDSTARGWAFEGERPVLVGLRREPDDLSARIEQRVRAMFRAGLADEVRGLIERYGRLAETAERAIGYAEAMDVIAGRCTENEAIERAALRTRRLAKRQRTWFAHQADVVWVDVKPDTKEADIAGEVTAQWGKYGASKLSV